MYLKQSTVKNGFCLFFWALLLLTIGLGCGSSEKKGRFSEDEMEKIEPPKRSELPMPAGGMTLSVSGETITDQEVIDSVRETLKENYSPNFQVFQRQALPIVGREVQRKVTDILLYEKARAKAPENIDDILEKAVETEVNRFVAQYGNDYALARQRVKEMGYDWQGFRDFQKKMMLTQSYVNKELEREPVISRKELYDYYQSNLSKYQWDASVQFQLIDIRASMLDPKLVEEYGDRDRAALQAAQRLVTRLRNGEDFGALAKEASHGHRALLGGKWDKVTAGSLTKPYDLVEQIAMNLEPGEISDPIALDGRVFIVKLIEKREAGRTPFEDVQSQIEAEVRLIKWQESFQKLVGELIEQANILNMDGFIQYCVFEAHQQLRSS